MAELWIDKDNIDRLKNHEIRRNGLPTVCGYLRVSTDMQLEGYSLEGQEKEIRHYFERRFGPKEFNTLWVVDEGVSGAKSFDTGGMKPSQIRGGLTLVTKLCERHDIEFLAIYDISRLARDTLVYLELCDRYIAPNAITLVSVQDGQESESGGREFSFELRALQATQYRRNLSRRIKDAKRARAEDGYIHGQWPYGWTGDGAAMTLRVRSARRDKPSEQDKGGYGRSRKRLGIVPVPEKAAVIRKMYGWYMTGRSLGWIRRELTQMNILSPRGNKVWLVETVRQVLLNPVHCGLMERNGHLVRGEFYEHRIVDEETYHAFVARYKKQSKVYATTLRSPKHLLGGIIKCAMCGRNMHFNSSANTKPKYYCNGVGKDHLRNHDRYGVQLSWIEHEVVTQMGRLARDPAVLAIGKERIQEALDAEEVSVEAEEHKIQQDILSNESERIELLDQLRRKKVHEDDYEIIRSDISRDRERLESELKQVQKRAERRLAREQQLKMALKMLRRFSVWDAMNLDRRRAVASYLIEELVVEPKERFAEVRLKLILSDPVKFEVPFRGCGGKRKTGMLSISAAELTTAYYLRRGDSEREIARRRGVSVDTIYVHKARLLRRAQTDDLPTALKMVEPLLESRKAELLIDRRRGKSFKDQFSAVEKQLLVYIAKGMSNREIAEAGHKSLATVAKQRRKVYEKLDVNNARDALRKAALKGIIDICDRQSLPTSRQMDVLRVLNTGCSQAQAAKRLKISLSALKERLQCMYAKFGVNKLEVLLKLARERGWLDETDE